jgi:Copper/zinc superoxide dismutase (SODC)
MHIQYSEEEFQANERTVNPFGKGHGAPDDSDRHVGDLGNVKTDGQGNAKGSITDNQVKLIGEQSVLGVRSSIFSYPHYLHITNTMWSRVGLLRTKLTMHLAHPGCPRRYRRPRQRWQRREQEDWQRGPETCLRRHRYRRINSLRLREGG